MSIPAHKNVEHPPGQIVNPVGDYSGVITPAKTLKDQIDRHTSRDEKKLTFAEWWEIRQHVPKYRHVEEDVARLIWTAGQRNV